MSKTEFQADHYDHLYPVGIEFQYWQIARNKTESRNAIKPIWQITPVVIFWSVALLFLQ
jgi:hypothetical protein